MSLLATVGAVATARGQPPIDDSEDTAFAVTEGQVGYHDGFETPDASFLLREADCGVDGLQVKRVFDRARTGAGCEHLRFVAGKGSKIYFARAIDRAPLLDELTPRLWVNCNKPRLQILARVVMPKAIDPRDGKPIARLIEGDVYGDIGQWQQLAVTDLIEKFQKKVPAWRKEFGKDFDPRMAYVDAIILNAYGGQGETKIWLDDLEIDGVLDPRYGADKDDKGRAPPAVAQKRPTVVAQGAAMLTHGRPFFLRAIEHNGESFEVLRRLGFNAAWLPAPATTAQLEDARQAGLWLIAPPPEGTAAIDSRGAESILAWSVGRNVTRDDLDATIRRTNDVRRRDTLWRRPVVCQPALDAWRYHRECDLIVLGRRVLGTSRELSDHVDDLRAAFDACGTTGPRWAAVDSDLSDSLRRQIAALPVDAKPSATVHPESIRLMALASIAAGARGIVFRSSASLTDPDPAAELRADALRLVNSELTIYEPWTASGSPPKRATPTAGACDGAIWTNERARLLVAWRVATGMQFEVAADDADAWRFLVTGAPQSERAYSLRPGALAPLKAPTIAGGLNVTIERPGVAAAVMTTQSPVAVSHLSRLLEAARLNDWEVRQRLAQNSLQRTQFTVQQLGAMGHRLDAQVQRLRSAQAALILSQRQASQNDYGAAIETVRKAEVETALARREPWELATARFASPTATPAGASFDLLPLHAELRVRVPTARWGPNLMPAGDFERLDALLQGGWRQRRHDVPEMEIDVDLSTVEPKSGERSLHLSARIRADQDAFDPAGVDRPPVWIVSPPIHARKGQLIHVRGFVKVKEDATDERVRANPNGLGGARGLSVYLTNTGPDMAERFHDTDGWRESTLFRAVEQTGPISVVFALEGPGEAWVDDVSLSLIELAPTAPPRDTRVRSRPGTSALEGEPGTPTDDLPPPR